MNGRRLTKLSGGVETYVSNKRERASRGRERPAFDDDQPIYFPPMSPQAQPSVPRGPELDATVKRFDAGRGFGFVALSDGSPDAFFHISKLKGGNVSPGTRLRVRVDGSPRGPEVTEVLSVEAARQMMVQGTVKWFDASKGFGFIKSDAGKDIFISLRILKHAGLSDLTEGQRVEVETVDA